MCYTDLIIFSSSFTLNQVALHCDKVVSIQFTYPVKDSLCHLRCSSTFLTVLAVHIITKQQNYKV